MTTDDSPAAGTVWLVNLFFGTGSAPTGTLLESAARVLAQQGEQVTAICANPGYNDGQSPATRRFPGKIVRLFCGVQSVSGTWRRFVGWGVFYLSVLLWAFTRRLPDTVVLLTTPPFLHWIFALRNRLAWRKARLILWNQDTYPEILTAAGLLPRNSLIERGLVLLDRFSARHVDLAIGLDRSMARLLAARGFRRVAVVPNWQVGQPADTSGSGDESAASEFIAGIHRSGRRVILYTGNLGWGHNLDLVLRFIREHPRHPHLFFLIVGGGTKRRDFEQLLENPDISCLGMQGYVPAAYLHGLLNSADVGLVSLQNDCVGLMSPSKIHEYLTAGLPLLYVGGAGSNVAEAIEQHSCGWRIDEQDYASLVDLLASIGGEGFQREPLRHSSLAAAEDCTEPRGTARWLAAVAPRS